jgi:hypothetical protein
VEAVHGHHARIGIDQFDQVGGVVIEGLLRGGSVSLYTLDPVVDGGPWEFALIAPFDVWMEQLGGDAVEVLRPGLAPVEDFGGPPNALHVLRRHRQPRISRGEPGPTLRLRLPRAASERLRGDAPACPNRKVRAAVPRSLPKGLPVSVGCGSAARLERFPFFESAIPAG